MDFDISKLVEPYTAHYSSFVLSLFILGLLVLIGAIAMIAYSLNNKPIKLGLKAPWRHNFDLPPLGGMVTRYLIDQGWISVNSLSQLFLKGIKFINSKLGDRAVYRLPWYIVVGTKNSGKSTLCTQVPLIRPFGEMDFGLHETSPFIKWYMFTKAIVIDVAGKIFLNNPQLDTDNHSFKSLLILLARYRAAKPLNGIILCISAKEIYGKDKLSGDELHNQANAILHNFVAIQNGLRLRLPVYVVVTNCDVIAGFKSFTQELPTKNKESIFGWSSPYHLQHAFSPLWMEEAFAYLNESIENIKLELLAALPTEQSNGSNDGIFAFSKEFENIEDGLSAYINRIFHDSSTHSAPILRGIYFTGDSSAPNLWGNNDGQVDESQKSKPALVFLKDLFDYKIFPESGVAKPIEGAIRSLNRGLNIIRNTTIGFSVIATYGMFQAYDSFNEKKERILPVLGKMNSLLRNMQHLKVDEPGHTGALFDTYARQLLEMMQELQTTSFVSALVPASWFSPLHNDLHGGLQLAYQEIVIKTIYVDLLLKARDLLNTIPTPKDRSNSLAALLNPLTCSEYLLLKKYVEGLQTLNDMLFKFNNLKSAPDSKDLDSLISYTFESRLPASFVNQYETFRKILNESSYPLIDLKPYEQMARQTLSVLYENFLNAMFSKNDLLTLPSRLQLLIESLQSHDKKQSINLEILRSSIGDLNDTSTSLGEIGSTWMDGKIFFPGKEFDELFDKIEMSPLFDKDVSQYLIDQTAIAFNRFKKLLLNINESLGSDAKQRSLPPSHGILSLEKSLTEMFRQSFMTKPDGKGLVTAIPNNKLLYWDPALIQKSFDTMKDFDNYISKDLISFPVLVQENLKISARINLQNLLLSMLGKSQTFIDIPRDITPGSMAERMLRAQVNDLKVVADHFLRLLEVLKNDDVSKAYMDLRNVLCSQCQWLLRQIDTYLDQLKIYKMKHDDFSWWDGKFGASLGAFAVRDTEELKHYVTVQRQVLLDAVNDFAKPIVELIKNSAFDNASGRDEALISKWIRLHDEIDAYGKKQAGNSLSQIENFFQKDMESWDYKEVIKNISLKEVKQKSGDYLLDIVKEIKLKLLARAEILQRNQAIVQYQHLVDFFNKHFKDKFPFVGGDLENSKGEVSPADIKQFFRMFKKYGDSSKSILDQIYQLGEFMKEPVEFLQNLETVKEFFATFINDKAAQTPSFDLKIDFRVARIHEKAGNMIVDWYIKTDEMTTISKHDKKGDGKWMYGQPITIGFKWPESSGGKIPQPENDSEQPVLNITSGTAEFVYKNQWALLWLLFSQATPEGGFSKKTNPDPYVLKFNIPMSDQSQTVVFNSISITKPGKDKVPKVITLPHFPDTAPDLPERALELKDQPILTDGVIKPISFEAFANVDNSEEDDDEEDTEDEEKSDKPKTKAN